MTIRIQPGDRTITWTESCAVAIGHHDCDVCGAETPEPTTADMIEFAKRTYDDRYGNYRGGTLWPGRDSGWIPAGWTLGDLLLCPECTAAKEAAFAERRKLKVARRDQELTKIMQTGDSTPNKGGT